MRRLSTKNSKVSRKRVRKNEDGVALITTLLLLLLMTGMAVAMVFSVNSDMMINGYYRNFRGSFYAADSGLNIARQQMLNQILASVPATFTATTQPIPAGTDATVRASILSTYGSYQAPTGTSGPSSASWPERYRISDVTLLQNSCTVVGGGGTCAAPTGTVTGYRYVYTYSMTAKGQSQGSEEASIADSGTLVINATLAPAGPTATSFAAWGMFIDQYDICSGGYLVPGTVSGPVFTNGAWTFGTSGKYTFTDDVGSASKNFGYQFSGGCYQSTNQTYTKSGTTIAPTYQGAVSLGANAVPLPDNDYSQVRAVLDGKGVDTTAVTAAQKNAALKKVSKAAYPTSGSATGVYMPYSVDSTTGAITMTGGGIYVEGNAAITLQPGTGLSQTYTIVQGTTTTTININPTTNTTTMKQGTGSCTSSTCVTISGVPMQYDPTTGAPVQDATMLYVNGAISSLSGPGAGQAAINDGVALTVTGSGNVTITGDLRYKNRPVTVTQNESAPGVPANSPADTLIPSYNTGQVLGVFTANGDIQLDNNQGSSNMEIDASLATISATGSGGLVNTGSTINTLTIVGGRIQNTIKNINSTTRNVFFDRRFSQNGFAPPWFPSTTVTPSGVSAATLTSSFQRVQWLNQTSYF